MENFDYIPDFVGSDTSTSVFVDNSTTINKSYNRAPRSRGGFGRGTFGLLRSVFLVLLVLVIFSYISTGRTDGWSFSRLLQVLQDVPDWSTPIIEWFRNRIDNLHIDLVPSTQVGAAIINFINHLTDGLSVFGFVFSGLAQCWAFIFYFLSLLFV